MCALVTGVQTCALPISPAVKGTMDARAALRLLLADTGLHVAEADGYTITLNTVIPRDNRVASTGAVAQVAPPQSQPQPQPQPSPAAETTTESADVRNLDTVTVTGSFIRRIDTETALPVTTLGQDEIDLSGASTVSDMLRSEAPPSELQSLLRNSYAVSCLKKKKTANTIQL